MEVQLYKTAIKWTGGKWGLPYKSYSDARQKIEINPLRETKVGAV